MAKQKKENKGKGGAGKFILGAAIGAVAGAVAGKFVKKKWMLLASIFYILLINYIAEVVIAENIAVNPAIAKTYSPIAIIPNTIPATAIPFPPFFLPTNPNIIASIAHGIDI